MDLQSTPFPGKSRPENSKMNNKSVSENKISSKEAPILSKKRVFGTKRSTNISLKTVEEKPVIKPTLGKSRQHPKPSRVISTKPRVTQSQPFTEPKLGVTEESNNVVLSPAIKPLEENSSDKITVLSPAIKAVGNSSSDKIKSKSKKNVCFQEPYAGGDASGVHTPVSLLSSSLIKRRTVGTPYHSAGNCSKCRFDRLESSSYWLAQITLAELVGKHFVAAAFFRLAFECNAEPVRTLRSELRRYLARHSSLSTETEWRDVSVSYGLLKEESNVAGLDSVIEKTDSSRNSADGLNQERKHLKEKLVEQSQTQLNLN